VQVKAKHRKAIFWILGTVAAVAVLGVMLRVQHLRSRSIVIRGAVIRRDADMRKELPISGAVVTISNGTSSASTRSTASGYFMLRYPPILWPGRMDSLTIQQVGYVPLDVKLPGGFTITTRQLYVAALEPEPEKSVAAAGGKPTVVSNIKVRYTVNSQNDVNVGSEARTFVVVNKGNVPCNHAPLCSPDGSWKAASASVTLDAGAGNTYRDVRASCIAGPCPFTRIDSSGFIRGGRTITASAIDWSDTVTILVEAEVFHSAISSNVRELYPVFFGQALHFTLPPTQEGVSIEADVNGQPTVFPLGPDVYLDWARCTMRTNSEADKTTVYRCELKPGYVF
jgi:hypothetical protein